ncbi:hypothetical protein FRB99_000569 [Tulasnella sp. 403]|nr:hypothetical protein FRB99_000569 [Tulasnella sp. 403]
MENNNAPNAPQPAQAGAQANQAQHAFMRLDNLQQAGGVQFHTVNESVGPQHAPIWNCRLWVTEVQPTHLQPTIHWDHAFDDGENGMLFLGDGLQLQAARDQAAFNALNAIGFQFP